MFVTLTIGAGALAAEPKEAKLVWELATPGKLPQAVVADARGRPLIFVAMKNGGLSVLELSAGNRPPRELATIARKQFGDLDVMQLAQEGDTLYLALGDFFNAGGAHAGLAVVSIQEPRTPRVLSFWKSKDKMQGAAAVAVRGKHAFLGAMSHGVVVLDVSQPTRVTHVTTYLPDVHFPNPNPGKIQHPNARGFAFDPRDDTRLFVAFDAGGLRVLDVGDPRAPRELGRYINAEMGKKQQAVNNLVIDGTTAYVAVDYAGLELLDVRDPEEIRPIAWWNPWDADAGANIWFNSAGHTNQIDFDAKKKRVYLSAGDSELLVVDVADRTQPRLVARYGDTKDQRGAWGVSLGKNHIYLSYIQAMIPFTSNWSGIKALER